MIYQIARWIKQLYFFPRTRFHLLYFFSRLLNSRGPELEFVLSKLPKKKGRIVDIGASSSLLVYELSARGYETYALDQRPYQEVLRGATFLELDLTKPNAWQGNPVFDIATAVSTLEHIGYGDYGDTIDPQGLVNAVKNIYDMLTPKAVFLATYPDEHSRRVTAELEKHFTLITYKHDSGNTHTEWRK